MDISDKSWHLITATVGDTDLIFYHNGEKIDAKQIPFLVKFEDAPQFIGLHQWEWNGPRSASRFNGAIDDVRIYKRALAPEEVRKIYRAE